MDMSSNRVILICIGKYPPFFSKQYKIYNEQSWENNKNVYYLFIDKVYYKKALLIQCNIKAFVAKYDKNGKEYSEII